MKTFIVEFVVEAETISEALTKAERYLNRDGQLVDINVYGVPEGVESGGTFPRPVTCMLPLISHL